MWYKRMAPIVFPARLAGDVGEFKCRINSLPFVYGVGTFLKLNVQNAEYKGEGYGLLDAFIGAGVDD